MEEEAAQTFFRIYAKEHSNAEIIERGTFLSRDMPFVGDSTDRIIMCDCCGKSCLEVKCTFSISHTTPTDRNSSLPYLKRDAQCDAK